MPQKQPLDVQIRQLAERQVGHVTRGQLLALGVTRSWVQGRIDQDRLVPVHAGVYALGHVPRHGRARAMAALLACGEGAALSHFTAAALWAVADWPGTLEVSSPRNRSRPGIRVHRSRTLTARELRTHHGLRVTSPARTTLDLQPRLTDARLVRTVNDLRISGVLGPTAFEELCGRSRRIDQLLGDGERPYGGRTPRATRSPLEDRFRAFVTRHRLPMPEINALLPESGREVDALYRGARLIVELDSWGFHKDRAAFERDRAKDARALADGYRTLRTTDRRLQRGGAEEADTIRTVLAGS